MSPRKILLFAIGPIGSAFIGLITVPILTWYFTQDDIGKMSMIPIVITFSSLFFSLGLDQAYVREYYEKDNKSSLFKTAFSPGLFFIVIVIFYFIFYNSYLPKLMFDTLSSKFNILILIIILASFFIRFISLYFRMNEQGMIYSISQLFPKLFFLLSVFLFILLDLNDGLYSLILANAISLLITLLFMLINFPYITSIFKEKINSHDLKSMLLFGYPLALASFAFWGLTSIDRILLRYLSSYEELAIYSVSVSFSASAGILQSIFTAVWIPIAYKWVKEGVNHNKINEITQYVLFVIVIVFSLMGLFSWCIPYLLPSEYNNIQWIIIASIGYPLFYTLSETTAIGINISRKSIFSMLATVISLIINIILNYLLIPQYGASGAAISSCISFLFLFLMRTEFSILSWKPIPRMKLYVYPLLLTFGSIMCNLLGSQLKHLSYIYWLVILSTVFIFFKNELAISSTFALKLIKK